MIGIDISGLHCILDVCSQILLIIYLILFLGLIDLFYLIIIITLVLLDFIYGFN